MTEARATSGRPVVGIVGTFDVANFGDLLFPEITAYELGQRLGPIELRRFSHRPMASPPWPYAVRPLDELIETVDALRLLIVGGGHLVRFDGAVAPGYESVASGIPHPTGYWLSPTIVAASTGVPVAWSAVGASPDTPGWAREMLAETLHAVEYVSVRDGDSLAELRLVAPSIRARLVPDTAFGIRAFLDAQATTTPSPWASAIDGRPYIVVQPSAALRTSAGAIREAIGLLDQTGLAVVELPVSPVLGDRVGALGDLGADVISVDPWPDPVSLARLVAGAQAVVAHSLHLSTVALAHGIPVFRAAMPAGTKYGILATFPGVATFKDGASLATALRDAQPGPISTQVAERVAQLEEHWDQIAALVGRDGDQAAVDRRMAGRRVLARLPAMIEAVDTRAASDLDAVRAELDAAAAARDAVEAERADSADRLATTSTRLLASAEHVADLAERIRVLETDVARERSQGAADRRRADLELAKARADLKDARAEMKTLRDKAAALDRLRRHRSVRAAMAMSRRSRRLLQTLGLRPRASSSASGKPPRRTATAEEQRAAEMALLASAPGSTRESGPLVSIVVLNRDGAHHLRRLLPALERTTYRSFEVLVVDNGSTDESLTILHGTGLQSTTIIQNAENQPFGEANNQAVAKASGEFILLLNNDVEPVGPGWLGRMVDTAEQRQATAVGARLVYPRRPDLENTGDAVFPDLTIQHRGIEFVAADGVPTGRNLGSGSPPDTDAASRTGDASAATAACLLVRRESFLAVGGFTEGYAYGTEDVDLCMKLRAAGGTIVYDGGAVLWHNEYGTQNAEGREWKRQNRRRNRQLFVDRWGPQVFREVFRDRVVGGSSWSETPLHVAITLTRDDPTPGWGDYHTAHELGEALQGLGWRVTYAERYKDRWYDLDPSVDVVISLLDAFDVRRIQRGIVTVAWIRNWTERWVAHPWFDEYDVVLASSERSREIVEERTASAVSVMPLATNPKRFAPRPATDALRTDLLFVGNRWGERRTVEDVLPALGDEVSISVFGRGWSDTDLAPFDRGPLAYDRLPDAYASARVVIDDTAGPTLPYGAVNARVFDALAAGALVVSDNETGIRELFGADFPVARDPSELQTHLAWAVGDPVGAAAVQAGFRDLVLEKHTYDHRAREIRDHLLAWVDAERYAILVGIPDWEQAPAWGDYHFARDLQRQLERRGHPTRIHLLPEWGRSPAARADVAIHVHGLSDHRPRPSQLNLLWIISHPDRVTPPVCERYDIVFVASDTFAADLEARVQVPVIPLHQATDPDRFTRDPSGPEVDLLFVANTRGVRRPILDDLMPTTHDLAIFGKGWTPDLVDPIYVRGEQVPNDVLNRYYASAKIVLNDHWADMRAHGFLSNRLYDALASGAFIVSDDALGLAEEFDGAVATYTDRDDLRRLIDEYLADPDARRRLADHGRAIVLERHTFRQRADRILEAVDALGLDRPTRLERLPEIEAWLDRRRRRAARATEPRTVTAGRG